MIKTVQTKAIPANLDLLVHNKDGSISYPSLDTVLEHNPSLNPVQDFLRQVDAYKGTFVSLYGSRWFNPLKMKVKRGEILDTPIEKRTFHVGLQSGIKVTSKRKKNPVFQPSSWKIKLRPYLSFYFGNDESKSGNVYVEFAPSGAYRAKSDWYCEDSPIEYEQALFHCGTAAEKKVLPEKEERWITCELSNLIEVKLGNQVFDFLT